MGRYRPPQKRGSTYITAEGYDRLQAEYKDLWQKRAHVTKILAAAAAEGDRSENAEYIYRKKQLREIDRRVRYLQKRLDELHVVRHRPDDASRVFFGAWVELENEQGETQRYRIVGPDEFNCEPGYISMDAPLAQALLGKSADDEVRVRLPSGEKYFCIISIHYPE